MLALHSKILLDRQGGRRKEMRKAGGKKARRQARMKKMKKRK